MQAFEGLAVWESNFQSATDLAADVVSDAECISKVRIRLSELLAGQRANGQSVQAALVFFGAQQDVSDEVELDQRACVKGERWTRCLPLARDRYGFVDVVDGFFQLLVSLSCGGVC